MVWLFKPETDGQLQYFVFQTDLHDCNYVRSPTKFAW